MFCVYELHPPDRLFITGSQTMVVISGGLSNKYHTLTPGVPESEDDGLQKLVPDEEKYRDEYARNTNHFGSFSYLSTRNSEKNCYT